MGDLTKYFTTESFALYHGDCLDVLPKLPQDSINMIFADPPYNLSNGGVTCKSGKFVSVNKGAWDKSQGFFKDFQFTTKWLNECKRVLAPNGTIWVSGTPHSIYSAGFALQQLGFYIMNEISWFKPNGPPNLSCKYFAHSHETLIWAKKDKFIPHKFNYEAMRFWRSDSINKTGKQMRSIWSIPLTPPTEKLAGKHPTQKPIELLMRIITACTDKGDLILDPFNGSGTTGIAAKKLGRNYIGIEKEQEYIDLTVRRVNNRL